MRALAFLMLVSCLPLAACGGPRLEARTFNLRYLDPGEAEQLIKPYVMRQDAPGTIAMARNVLSVRATRNDLDQIARVLAEHDTPRASVLLTFQVIRANGESAPDTAIAGIEAQLRPLFRFRGYQLVAQGMTNVGANGPVSLRLDGKDGPYVVNGRVEVIDIQRDSGTVRLGLEFSTRPTGKVLETQVSVRIGQTMVLGGQTGSGPGAIILAVRAELSR